MKGLVKLLWQSILRLCSALFRKKPSVNLTDRYGDLPELLGHAIARHGIKSGWVQRVDRTVKADLIHAVKRSNPNNNCVCPRCGFKL
jgi:hypothetical protein